jgi:hypothetical protein
MNSIKAFLVAPFGLGDLAYYAFRPFAYLIDWAWGTDLKACDKCHERRVLWNNLVSVPRWQAMAGAIVIIALASIV